MRNVDLYDVRVMDGYVLRFLLVRQLNEYVLELNFLFSRLSEFDFDVIDIYVFYAYQKLFISKVERFRMLLSFLCSVELVGKKSYSRMMSALDEMVEKVS